jgi:hypothetical protein
VVVVVDGIQVEEVEQEVIELHFQVEQKLTLSGYGSTPVTVGGGGAGAGVPYCMLEVVQVILQYFQQLHQQVVEVEVLDNTKVQVHPGGSGGGGTGFHLDNPGGSGNTPPVSPPQGNPGGNAPTNPVFGGGGGEWSSRSSGLNSRFYSRKWRSRFSKFNYQVHQ